MMTAAFLFTAIVVPYAIAKMRESAYAANIRLTEKRARRGSWTASPAVVGNANARPAPAATSTIATRRTQLREAAIGPAPREQAYLRVRHTGSALCGFTPRTSIAGGSPSAHGVGSRLGRRRPTAGCR